MTHTLKLDRLRTSRRWTAIGPAGRLGDYDDAEAAVLALREAGATSVALSMVDGPPADFTPTIEQVAEALGEPWAHLAPFSTHDQLDGPGSDLVPALWWAVYRWSDGAWPVFVYTNDGNLAALAGPTRADALRAAWAYITSRQEPTP